MRKIALLAATALTILSSAANASDSVTVRDNPGGVVVKFVIVKAKLDYSNTLIKIGGYCASACTVFLGAKNICIESDALFAFHQGSDPWATEMMIDSWPLGVKMAVRDKLPTFESHKLLKISGSDMQKLFELKSCD